MSDMSRLLAEKFHDAYERLAPSFGYETRIETRKFDPESPNGRLMIAVVSEVAADRIEELEMLLNASKVAEKACVDCDPHIGARLRELERENAALKYRIKELEAKIREEIWSVW